jgi:hypothetical protein
VPIERSVSAATRLSSVSSESDFPTRVLGAAVSLAAGISGQISQTLVAEITVDAVFDTLDARRVLLLLDPSGLIVDRRQGETECTALRLTNSLSLEELPLRLMSEALLGKSVVMTEVARPAGEARSMHDEVGLALCMPLVSYATVMGRLYVELSKGHGDAHAVGQFIALAAGQCAAALERLEWVKDTQHRDGSRAGRLLEGQDLGPAFEDFAQVARTHAIASDTSSGSALPTIDELTQTLVDPLSCIMLDAQAAICWLVREHPDFAMATSSLLHIKEQAGRIFEAVERHNLT